MTFLINPSDSSRLRVVHQPERGRVFVASRARFASQDVHHRARCAPAVYVDDDLPRGDMQAPGAVPESVLDAQPVRARPRKVRPLHLRRCGNPPPSPCRFSSSRASGSHCPNATARRRRASYAHRLEEYDATNALARMTHDGASLWVDVMAVPGADAPRLGSLYQIIGEMDSCAGNEEPGRRAEGPVLRARVVRCVDGLDVGIYYQALKERNAFLR